MIFLFRKPKAKVNEEDRNKAERMLMKSAHNLGYEVGYHRHSEIGWVDDEYTEIRKKAKKYYIEDKIKAVYDRGKKKGMVNREQAISSGLSKKPAFEEKERKNPSFTRSETEEPQVESRSSSEGSFKFLDQFMKHEIPEATNRPDVVERSKAVELPSFLNSIQFLRRR